AGPRLLAPPGLQSPRRLGAGRARPSLGPPLPGAAPAAPRLGPRGRRRRGRARPAPARGGGLPLLPGLCPAPRPLLPPGPSRGETSAVRMVEPRCAARGRGRRRPRARALRPGSVGPAGGGGGRLPRRGRPPPRGPLARARRLTNWYLDGARPPGRRVRAPSAGEPLVRLRPPSAREIAAALRSELPLSYPEAGATAKLDSPETRNALASRYDVDHRGFALGRGRGLFERAQSALRAWRHF